MEILFVKQEEKQTEKQAAIFDFFAALFLTLSFWFTLFSMLEIHFSFGVGIKAVVITAIFTLLSTVLGRNEKFGKYTLFYAFLFASLVLTLGYAFFQKAFSYTANLIINVLNEKNSFLLLPFDNAEHDADPTLLILSVFTLLTWVFVNILVAGLRNKNAFAPLLITVVPVTLGLLFNLEPGIFPLAVMIISMAAFLILCVSDRAENAFGTFGTAVQTVGFLLIFICLFWAAFSELDSIGVVQRVKSQIGEKIYEIRYVPESAKTVAAMPKGDLRAAGPIEFTGNPVMNITMEYPSPVFLRTFVGDTFSENAWTTLPKGAYAGKYLGMAEWLEKRDFYPFMSLSRLYAYESERTGSSAKLGNIHVKTIANCTDVILAPYELVSWSSFSSDRLSDTHINTKGVFGEDEYDLKVYSTVFPDYASSDLQAWVKLFEREKGFDDYLACENLYRNFVYENYLTADQKYASSIDGSGLLKYSEKEIPYITFKLREYFSSNFTYDVSAELGGADSFEKFLNTKTGYDPYFATYAALLFRSLGIPARYAEGYCLTEGEMSKYASETNLEFDVCDTTAHAWTEIYIDSVGWVPVEVTPGFYTLDEIENDSTEQITEHIQMSDDQYYHDEVDIQKKDPSPTVADSDRLPVYIWLAIPVILVLIVLLAMRIHASYMLAKIRTAQDADATLAGYRLLLKKAKRKEKRKNAVSLSDCPGFSSYENLVYKECYSKDGLSPDERRAASDFVLNTLGTL